MGATIGHGVGKPVLVDPACGDGLDGVEAGRRCVRCRQKALVECGGRRHGIVASESACGPALLSSGGDLGFDIGQARQCARCVLLAGDCLLYTSLRRVGLLKRSVKYKAVDVHYHDPATSFVEAVMSRGGREVADWVEAAWRRGARFDAWTELFNEEAWTGAAEELGLDPAAIAQAEFPTDYVLPWAHITAAVSPKFLARERERAAAGITTPDCTFENCSACGACPTLGVDIELQQERCLLYTSLMNLPLDIPALLKAATDIDEARNTPLAVSVYIDETAPGDVVGHVRSAFASAGAKTRVTIGYLDDNLLAEPYGADDMAVIVAGDSPRIGEQAAHIRGAGIPVMVATTAPHAVAAAAEAAGWPVPEGDIVAPNMTNPTPFGDAARALARRITAGSTAKCTQIIL